MGLTATSHAGAKAASNVGPSNTITFGQKVCQKSAVKVQLSTECESVKVRGNKSRDKFFHFGSISVGLGEKDFLIKGLVKQDTLLASMRIRRPARSPKVQECSHEFSTASGAVSGLRPLGSGWGST